MDTKYYEKLMRFLREEGILYGPSPEIYGGLSGFYSYGPLGMRIKKNIEKEILDLFNRFEFFEISAPIIMPSVVFEASGHLGNFTDPLVKCSKCKSVFRLDHIYEKELPTKKEELLKIEIL
jgi:glycyl-tRNA synthetase